MKISTDFEANTEDYTLFCRVNLFFSQQKVSSSVFVVPKDDNRQNVPNFSYLHTMAVQQCLNDAIKNGWINEISHSE